MTGRKEADCTLSIRILRPVVTTNDAIVKALATDGFTLKGAPTVVDGQRVHAVITLPDGFEAAVDAKVSWVRPELQLAGFKFLAVDAEVLERIGKAVDGLQAAPQAVTGRTIVVADDDPSILDFAFRAISKSGHRVLRADRGDTALQLIKQERPWLVLLDVLMPGLDGLEICKEMRKDEQLARIPVVLLSAMGETRLRDAVSQSGANDFLTKPMHLEALRNLVAEYVG
jgi:CheY-like chemotaxis protein